MYSPSEIERFKALFLASYNGPGSYGQAVAAAGGPSRKSFERWQRQDEAFDEAVYERDESAADEVESEVRRIVRDPKTPPQQRLFGAALFLNARRPATYHRGTHRGDDESGPVTVQIVFDVDPSKRLPPPAQRLIDMPTRTKGSTNE